MQAVHFPEDLPPYSEIEIRKTAFGEDANELLYSVILSKDQCEAEVVEGKYEGGLKIWECTIDLCELMLDSSINSTFSNTSVCELGCGQALPGVLARKLGASHVLFQDLNQDVLTDVTTGSIGLNCGVAESDQMALYCGTWDSMLHEKSLQGQYDILLSSETLYRECHFEDICQVILHLLKPLSGRAYFSSKVFYFGMDGGTEPFADFVEENYEGRLSVDVIHRVEDGSSNVREILLIKKVSM